MSLLRPRRTFPRNAPAAPVAEAVPIDVLAERSASASVDSKGGVSCPSEDVVPPLYSGLSRLNNWGETARSGMTVDLALRDVGPLAVHPFKGLSWGKENGQRFRLWVALRPDDEVDPATLDPVYMGESILMFWGDTCSAGMHARFLLDAGPDGTAGLHPFKDFPHGPKEGQELLMAAWAVADDESTQHPRHVRRKTPFWELSEVKQSQILCRDARFVSYLAANESGLAGRMVSPRPDEDPLKFAETVVKTYLDVASRSVMNTDTAEGRFARERWRKLLEEYGYFRDGYR